MMNLQDMLSFVTLLASTTTIASYQNGWKDCLVFVIREQGIDLKEHLELTTKLCNGQSTISYQNGWMDCLEYLLARNSVVVAPPVAKPTRKMGIARLYPISCHVIQPRLMATLIDNTEYDYQKISHLLQTNRVGFVDFQCENPDLLVSRLRALGCRAAVIASD